MPVFFGNRTLCVLPAVWVPYDSQNIWDELLLRDTRQRSWLRHYATSREVAGSITDEVIGFFQLILAVALWPWGWLSLLTEMGTSNLSGSKWRSARMADNLTAICEPIVKKMWEPLQPVTWIALPFLCFLLDGPTPSRSGRGRCVYPRCFQFQIIIHGWFLLRYW
jgi:hypothetical protein